MMATIQYFWRHPLAEEVREEGREEGRLEALAETTINILRWRGIDVPDDVRARVQACTDLARLTTWSQRAVHAATAEDLFLAAD
ncbi:hypothetical protein [Streptomyces sp. NPDC088766]|uniref:hypothetical protein n=1 Tax=Streptomyces sp. NPDC088766 TaxID=3365893 RepID=UPI0037FABE11